MCPSNPNCATHGAAAASASNPALGSDFGTDSMLADAGINTVAKVVSDFTGLPQVPMGGLTAGQKEVHTDASGKLLRTVRTVTDTVPDTGSTFMKLWKGAGSPLSIDISNCLSWFTGHTVQADSIKPASGFKKWLGNDASLGTLLAPVAVGHTLLYKDTPFSSAANSAWSWVKENPRLATLGAAGLLGATSLVDWWRSSNSAETSAKPTSGRHGYGHGHEHVKKSGGCPAGAHTHADGTVHDPNASAVSSTRTAESHVDGKKGGCPAGKHTHADGTVHDSHDGVGSLTQTHTQGHDNKTDMDAASSEQGYDHAGHGHAAGEDCGGK